MGPLFNPVFWFFGLLIIIVAGVVTLVTGMLVFFRPPHPHNSSLKRRSVQHWLTTLSIALTVGILTCCGLDYVLLRDPSAPFFPPSRESIIGTWTPSTDALDKMRRDGGYIISTHPITFDADGTFTMVNMPDWWLGFKHESHRGLYSGTGTWKIEKEFDYWVVGLYFSSYTSEPDGLHTSLHIRDWNGKRTIYYQFGEMGPILAYEKQ